jgi:hypothetical protein
MSIFLAGGHQISNPEDRVREYVEIEVYFGYDDRHSVSDEIKPDDIRAANRLYARVGSVPAEAFITSARVHETLGAVQDEELDAIPDSRWAETRTAIAELFGAAIELRGIGLAVASKVLHLKRPHLIPILDSFVVRLLDGAKLERIDKKGQLVDIGLRTLDIIRSDMHRQQKAFAELQASLCDLPLPLTRVRLFDILCWSTEKWDVRGDTTGPFGRATRSLSPPGA